MPSMSTGCCDERNDEADGGGRRAGNHQDAEPTHIEAVVGAGDPLAELFTQKRLALLDGGRQSTGKKGSTDKPSSGDA